MTIAPALATPQTAHLGLSAGESVRLDTDLRVTPLGCSRSAGWCAPSC